MTDAMAPAEQEPRGAVLMPRMDAPPYPSAFRLAQYSADMIAKASIASAR